MGGYKDVTNYFNVLVDGKACRCVTEIIWDFNKIYHGISYGKVKCFVDTLAYEYIEGHISFVIDSNATLKNIKPFTEYARYSNVKEDEIKSERETVILKTPILNPVSYTIGRFIFNESNPYNPNGETVYNKAGPVIFQLSKAIIDGEVDMHKWYDTIMSGKNYEKDVVIIDKELGHKVILNKAYPIEYNEFTKEAKFKYESLVIK